MLILRSRSSNTMDSKTSPYKRQFNVKVLFRFVPATPSRSASSMSRSCFALSLSLSQVIVGCQGRDPRLGKALPETFRVIRILSIRDAMAIGGSIARSRSRLQLHTKLTLQSKPPQSLDRYWPGVRNGPYATHPLATKPVTRGDILVIANWVYRQATQADFRGSAAVRPTTEQPQAVIDIVHG